MQGLMETGYFHGLYVLCAGHGSVRRGYGSEVGRAEVIISELQVL